MLPRPPRLSSQPFGGRKTGGRELFRGIYSRVSRQEASETMHELVGDRKRPVSQEGGVVRRVALSIPSLLSGLPSRDNERIADATLIALVIRGPGQRRKGLGGAHTHTHVQGQEEKDWAHLQVENHDSRIHGLPMAHDVRIARLLALHRAPMFGPVHPGVPHKIRIVSPQRLWTRERHRR